MEFMEVGVRVQLDKLKVSRVDDGFLAGSADEPYLWLIAAKVDGTTIFENSPGTATVAVLSTSAAPGNLGPASQGVEAGRTIAIPKSVGRIDTTLRGTTGGVLTLTQFATLVVAIAALEHDDSRVGDIVDLHDVVITESKRRLETELREIVAEVLAGDIPTASEVRKRLEAQIDEETLEDIIDDFGHGLIGAPVNLLNQDVFVGHNVDTVLTFPRVLANSIDGFPIKARLRRGKPDEDRPVYWVTGGVTRTDIQEPPTVGLVLLGDNRLRLCGRSIGKRVFLHERTAAGEWKGDKPFGNGVMTSGVTMAASADGARMYAVARGVDNRLHFKHPESGDTWPQLFSRTFATGGGIACSSDGQQVFVAGTGTDGKVYVSTSTNGGKGFQGDFTSIGVTSVASPALACSADGRTLFIATLGADRKIWQTIVDVTDGKVHPKISLPLDSLRFKSAPAVACSDDGKRVHFAGLGEDGVMRILEPEVTKGSTDFWRELDKAHDDWHVSAPALACSPDGKTIHIAAIDHSLRLTHRFSPDGGKTWPHQDGERWHVVRENAAWY
ncbi:MAG: hypothetical protein U0R18_11485 [Mycobacterium sp.]